MEDQPACERFITYRSYKGQNAPTEVLDNYPLLKLPNLNKVVNLASVTPHDLLYCSRSAAGFPRERHSMLYYSGAWGRAVLHFHAVVKSDTAKNAPHMLIIIEWQLGDAIDHNGDPVGHWSTNELFLKTEIGAALLKAHLKARQGRAKFHYLMRLAMMAAKRDPIGVKVQVSVTHESMKEGLVKDTSISEIFQRKANSLKEFFSILWLKAKFIWS